MPIGIRTPLEMAIDELPFQPTYTVAEEASENLKAVMLTKEGELSWEPGFGVGLESYLFEHDTDSLRSELSARIEKQISTYISFIELLDIQYTDVNNHGVLSITISYAVVSAGLTGETSKINFVYDGKNQIWKTADDLKSAEQLGSTMLAP